jgi:hypothetical protein
MAVHLVTYDIAGPGDQRELDTRASFSGFEFGDA